MLLPEERLLPPGAEAMAVEKGGPRGGGRQRGGWGCDRAPDLPPARCVGFTPVAQSDQPAGWGALLALRPAPRFCAAFPACSHSRLHLLPPSAFPEQRCPRSEPSIEFPASQGPGAQNTQAISFLQLPFQAPSSLRPVLEVAGLRPACRGPGGGTRTRERSPSEKQGERRLKVTEVGPDP